MQRSWGSKELYVLKNHPVPPRSCLFGPLALRSAATPLLNASATGPPNSRALFILLSPRAVSGTSCFASQDDSRDPLGTTVPLARPSLFAQISCPLCLCCCSSTPSPLTPTPTSFLCCVSSQRSVPSLQDYLPTQRRRGHLRRRLLKTFKTSNGVFKGRLGCCQIERMEDTAEGGDGKCRGQEHEEPQRRGQGRRGDHSKGMG